jgi:hypothetical protein
MEGDVEGQQPQLLEGDEPLDGEERVLTCPQCGSPSIEYDFDAGGAVCSACGYLDETGQFETLGRVIGGGPEAGRVDLFQGQLPAATGTRSRYAKQDLAASREAYRSSKLVSRFSHILLFLERRRSDADFLSLVLLCA